MIVKKEYEPQFRNTININRYIVFKWIVYRISILEGGSIEYKANLDIPRINLGSNSYYTKGSFSVTRPDGSPGLTTSAGMRSIDSPDIPEGITTFTATEFSEYWCFEAQNNKNNLPNVTMYNLGSGESFITTDSSIGILLCTGKISIDNLAIDAVSSIADISVNTQVTAIEPAILLCFKQRDLSVYGSGTYQTIVQT